MSSAAVSTSRNFAADPAGTFIFRYEPAAIVRRLAPGSALLGTPLAIGRRQGGRAWGYLLTLGGYVLFYLLMRLFEQLAQQGQLPVALAGQLTNLLFCAAGLVAMYRVNRSGTVR